MSNLKESHVVFGAKPRMREMYGIWSCISQNAWGAGWNAESAYEDWKKKLTLNIWISSSIGNQAKSGNGRFG
jgi:hypothetical protein